MAKYQDGDGTRRQADRDYKSAVGEAYSASPVRTGTTGTLPVDARKTEKPGKMPGCPTGEAPVLLGFPHHFARILVLA